MKTIEETNNALSTVQSESLAEFAEAVALEHIRSTNPEQRKARGQFFTPKAVARFMVSLFNIRGKSFSLLDPGGGAGILTAAFCERLLSLKTKVKFTGVVYETDVSVVPLLEKVLKKCQAALEDHGHEVTIYLRQQDFIVSNEKFFTKEGPTLWANEHPQFDYVISNPPYFKLNAASLHAKIMRKLDLGHPNVYAFFLALSLRLLRKNGELVFIIPRSFCSGFYYRKFRDWLLNNASFAHIHSFQSRRQVFENEGVLQENIILKAMPRIGKTEDRKVKVTVSQNHRFEDIDGHDVPPEDIVHKMRKDTLIKIPISEAHIAIQRAVEDWKYTLHDLGLEVSTGPVVDFRAKELLSEFKSKKTTAPLFWMHNIQNMKVVWPAEKKGKHAALKINKDSEALLLPVRNYVLIKRFSSKEQNRRLYAGSFFRKDFDGEFVGFENHVNYLYRKNGSLTPEETLGITALLNSSILDEYFRCLNGNTQVNASDLRAMPFPSISTIQKIGKTVARKKVSVGPELDKVVNEIFGVKFHH